MRMPVVFQSLCCLLVIALILQTTDARAADDSRLSNPWTLDHPFPFNPTFKTKDDWQQRAATLRQQVQVALGLWPMPDRPPIKPVIWGRIERDEYTIDKVY